MNEIDKAREAAWIKECAEHGMQVPPKHESEMWNYGFDAGLATATAKIEALEAKLAAAEKLCDAEVFAVVYSNYDPLEIDSLWATEQLAIDHRDRLNDSMWTVVRMTVHSKPYTADEENTDA